MKKQFKKMNHIAIKDKNRIPIPEKQKDKNETKN